MQQTDAFINRVWEENVIDCLKLFLVNILGSGGFSAAAKFLLRTNGFNGFFLLKLDF